MATTVKPKNADKNMLSKLFLAVSPILSITIPFICLTNISFVSLETFPLGIISGKYFFEYICY